MSGLFGLTLHTLSSSLCASTIPFSFTSTVVSIVSCFSLILPLQLPNYVLSGQISASQHTNIVDKFWISAAQQISKLMITWYCCIAVNREQRLPLNGHGLPGRWIYVLFKGAPLMLVYRALQVPQLQTADPSGATITNSNIRGQPKLPFKTKTCVKTAMGYNTHYLSASEWKQVRGVNLHHTRDCCP